MKPSQHAVTVETELVAEPEASELTSAPEHVQLAVDLIYLLESNEVSPQTALSALDIVKQDLLTKCSKSHP